MAPTALVDAAVCTEGHILSAQFRPLAARRDNWADTGIGRHSKRRVRPLELFGIALPDLKERLAAKTIDRRLAGPHALEQITPSTSVHLAQSLEVPTTQGRYISAQRRP